LLTWSFEVSAWPASVTVEVGEPVLGVDGRWMIRPPQRCANGHPITPGRVLVGSIACGCGERRHLTWLCDCGSMMYGPALGTRHWYKGNY